MDTTRFLFIQSMHLKEFKVHFKNVKLFFLPSKPISGYVKEDVPESESFDNTCHLLL